MEEEEKLNSYFLKDLPHERDSHSYLSDNMQMKNIQQRNLNQTVLQSRKRQTPANRQINK